MSENKTPIPTKVSILRFAWEYIPFEEKLEIVLLTLFTILNCCEIALILSQ